jgi:hypothetical protein
MCLFWIGFAEWVAPHVISTAYDERNLWILNRVFQGRRWLPVEHYLHLWNVIAAAVLLAALLHLMIVFFICGTDRKHRVRFAGAALSFSNANAALIVFSAAFLALAVFSGVQGDYRAYLEEWTAVLRGANPWDQAEVLNPLGPSSYGPLFNVLAPLAWLNPLANKLLFAFSYLVYVIWLIKEFAPRQGVVAFSWPWVCLWVLNPFPWEQIAYFGYFDVLVSLACVAAVHSFVRGKNDGVSGTYLALGILLKYMPVVILPFLVLSERRFHFRLLSFCVGVTIAGFLVSIVVWGTSTFFPLTFIATRPSDWSIYTGLHPLYSLDWLEKPLLLTGGLGMFTWCVLRRIEPVLSSALAILVTLLFYRIGFANYQMVLFSLILYWSVSNWARFKEHFVLTALLIGYFSFLAVDNYIFWSYPAENFTIFVIMLFKFLLGCVLLAGLVQLRPTPWAEQRLDGGTKYGRQSFSS